MKRLTWLILAMATVALLTGCASTRRSVTEQKNHTRSDSVVVKDSLVVRDSVVIRYATTGSDSVVVRDSVVVTLDATGKVVKTERYRSSDRKRETTHETASERVRSEAERGTTTAVHGETVTVSRRLERSVAWYVWVMVGTGVAAVAGTLGYSLYRARKEAKG